MTKNSKEPEPVVVQLPLLPLWDHVLLPGGFVWVLVPQSWRKSAPLVQHLLQQQGNAVYVAAVPYSPSKPLGEEGGTLPGLEGEDHLDLDKLHHIGTAARVLQLVKHTQNGGWGVTLEGVCRLRVRDVALSSLQEMFVATAEQVDYLGGIAPGLASQGGPRLALTGPGAAPSSAAGGSGSSGSSRGGGKGGAGSSGRRGAGSSSGPAAEDGSGALVATKVQEELVQELLQSTRTLFLLVQGPPDGREAGASVTKMLSAQGPARVADVLGGLVARDVKERLLVLSTLDVTRRLEVVRELMTKLLAATAKAIGGMGGSSGASRPGALVLPPGARAGRAGLSQAFRLPSQLGGGGAEGEDDDGQEELSALMRKLQEASPPPEVLRVALREFKRLQRSSEQLPGYAMALSYLETLAELPWNRWSHQMPPQPAAAPGGAPSVDQGQGSSEAEGAHFPQLLQQQQPLGNGSAAGAVVAGASGPAARPSDGQLSGVCQRELSLGEVRQRLDAAHYGLDKIKDRIVQYVAVQRLRGWDARAPILCFIGPPGVGKTSLARCVGDVLGRPFQRISLGGVRDEAEVRGHRRTYIGAMPGRVIQAVRRAGVRDPVLLLDEVDKMGRDSVRGDPAAALLEVLDPEQNSAFVDTYLGVPFDLSGVVFVSTANRAAEIPPPLLDRMEVVHLAGYTLDEKLAIAARHLVPRALSEHGLLPGQLVFPRVALRLLAEGYTREAGVRTLARCLAAVCRHVAVQVVTRQEAQDAAAAAAVAAAAAAQEEGSGSGSGRHGLPFVGVGRPAGEHAHDPMPLPGSPDAGAAAAAAAAAGRVGHLAAGAGTLSASLRHKTRLGAVSPQAGCLRTPAPTAESTLRAAQLWALLSSVAPPAVPAQHAKRGRQLQRDAGARTALGGYPWPHLHLTRQQRSTPAPQQQQQQQQQQPGNGGSSSGSGGGGGWLSWLPWSAPWRQPGHAEAEGEEEDGGYGAEHAQHAQQAPMGGVAVLPCVGDAWGGGHPQEHASMSLAGSMHSMPFGRSAAQRPLPPPPAALRAGAAGGAWAPGNASSPHLIVAGPTGGSSQGAALAQESAQQQQLERPGAAVDHLGMGPLGQVVVDEALIEEVLGPRRFTGHDNSERVASPGTAAGLVWTAVGGQVQYIECLCVGRSKGEGGGSLTLTGQLGDVLEESARIALSWVRAHAQALGLPGGPFCPSASWDVHIHLPAGAVQKDGPSAGVTLATALVSLFTGKRVRDDTAMTGELTLRGLVLPVGGMKEKLLAAHTAGMARVIVPARNMRDVQADVPKEVREGLQVLPAERLEDVLRHAFDPPLELQQQQPLARL